MGKRIAGKQWLAWTCMAIAVGCGVAVASPVQARAVVGVSIGIAPPPLRVERVALRPGYAWAPGYWRWNGARHVWVGGYWLPARHGYRYRGASWVRVGPDWRFRRARWVRL
jgi:hypothetical protein